MAIAKRKQRFYDVEIPLIGKETQLRDFEKESLNGKFVKYDLTRYLRGKNSVLVLKVKATNEKAVAEPRSITLLPSFLRRMVRKGTNYVEDSFFIECKDAKARIKPFLITRRKVSRAVRKALREKVKEELINYAKTRNVNSIFDDVLKNQLQKTLSLKLKKIYPLSLCEIRILKVSGDVKEIEEPKKEEKKKSKKEEIVSEEVEENKEE
jgi:ribosomal protein S3AE